MAGDTLVGDKIYAEARKIDGPRVIVKTGRHRAQSITLVLECEGSCYKEIEVCPEG